MVRTIDGKKDLVCVVDGLFEAADFVFEEGILSCQSLVY
jgi:hypothetical protein